MPVTWNAESKEKLFIAVMALHPITGLDCIAVATMFGDGVTASAIQNQMKRIRKEAVALAAARGSVSVSKTVAPKGILRTEPHSTKRGKQSTNKKRKAKDMAHSASEGEGGDSDDRAGLVTPQPSTKQLMVNSTPSKRISPRGMAKKDYKAMEYPAYLKDTVQDDGNAVFEEEKVGSDGSDSADGEYGEAMGTQMIKNEGSDGGSAGQQNLKVEHDGSNDSVV